jgi:hypothetical protein
MVSLIKCSILFFSINLFSCKDDKLILPKENNLSNKLNLNGYYFTKSNNNPKANNIFDVFFLYENGIILYVGSLEKNDELTISNYINNEILLFKSIYKSKLGWGLYTIKDNSIKIETWSPSSGGKVITTTTIGTILNKNSYKITEEIGKRKNFYYEEIFEFRQFNPKPDSTNNFIK